MIPGSGALPERPAKVRQRRLWAGPIVLLAGFTVASTASAHEDHGLSGAARRWSWDPWALPFVLGVGLAYGVGLFSLWRRAGAGHGVRPSQAVCFGCSWAVLIIALLSPLDELSSVFFSAHMAQHELLMLVAAPLFVLGAPYRVIIHAIPERFRSAAAGPLRAIGLSSFWRVLTTPVIVLSLQLIVLSVWHVPGLFEAALQNEGVHTLQHALFFGSAVLFWWTLIAGRYGAIGYGVGLLFVFMTALHGGTLGALIMVARRTWYPSHAERTAAAGADALADQQLAGLLMWVPGGLLLLAAALALGFAWLGTLEQRTKRQALTASAAAKES